MVLIPPEEFIKDFEDASLEDIYYQKKEFMEFIREYESGVYDEIDHLREPSYFDQYYNCKRIVEGLNKLIEIKKEEFGNNDNNQLVDELERLGNMYKEGLLTDEEFAAMKRKLIKGD